FISQPHRPYVLMCSLWEEKGNAICNGTEGRLQLNGFGEDKNQHLSRGRHRIWYITLRQVSLDDLGTRRHKRGDLTDDSRVHGIFGRTEKDRLTGRDIERLHALDSIVEPDRPPVRAGVRSFAHRNFRSAACAASGQRGPRADERARASTSGGISRSMT